MFDAEQLTYARRRIYELISEKDPAVAPRPGPLEEHRFYGHDSYRYCPIPKSAAPLPEVRCTRLGAALPWLWPWGVSATVETAGLLIGEMEHAYRR